MTDLTKQLPDGRVVLCGANAYEEKYFFNPDFNKLPEAVKEELRVICVLYTQETGGIFMILFDEDGDVLMETVSDEDDVLYDEVSAGLLIGEIRRNRQELFEQIKMFYKLFILEEQNDPGA
ncbi:MAG: hypothetical protein J5842_06310 [Lachnospiraceae bacterium]|nr:hypothetical protein [Lachnospiraceae bacterium]